MVAKHAIFLDIMRHRVELGVVDGILFTQPTIVIQFTLSSEKIRIR